MSGRSYVDNLSQWFEFYDPKGIEPHEVQKLISFRNKTILEIGCCTGKNTVPNAKTAREYIAIDSDSRVIRYCKKKYTALKQCHFSVENAEKLSFVSGRFDIYFCPWVFNYIQNRKAFIREMARVLKPRGYAVLIETSEHSDFDEIMDGLIPSSPIDPVKEYEKPLQPYFQLVRKHGPISVPYRFPNIETAHCLVSFIIKDYFGKNLTKAQDRILQKRLEKFRQKDGSVRFHERPLFYLFQNRGFKAP